MTSTRPRSFPFGIALMAVFSLVWMSNAAGSSHRWVQILGAIGIALALGLGVCWWRARNDGDHAPAPASRRPGRAFAVAVAAEVVGIIVAINVAARISPALVMPAIALVVALHFLLVDRAFPSRVHRVMTVIGCVVAVFGGYLALNDTPAADVRGIVGLGMGAITLAYGALFAAAQPSLRPRRG